VTVWTTTHQYFRQGMKFLASKRLLTQAEATDVFLHRQ
jgi:hypothetical protein